MSRPIVNVNVNGTAKPVVPFNNLTEVSQSIKEINDELNNIARPDDEDITTKDGLLKFSDKEYNPEDFSGLGRIYLRKNLVEVYEDNIWAVKEDNGVAYLFYSYHGTLYNFYNYDSGLVLKNHLVVKDNIDYDQTVARKYSNNTLGFTEEDGVIVIELPNGETITSTELNQTSIPRLDILPKVTKNILTQQVFQKQIDEETWEDIENTIYVIQYDYDLAGQTITIPEGCTLKFEGGSISNGTLVGNETILQYEQNVDDIFTNVIFEGTFIHKSGSGAPDEEDLTIKNNKLQFKDKNYAPENFSGLGRVYLRKNIVNNKNVLTQADFSDANTIYIIQYDYDLNGATITVPDGCTLEFDGGSIANGRILNSGIKIKASRYSIFRNVYFFDAATGLEFVGDGISVRVTQNDKFFNVLTKKKAVINDIADASMLYPINNPSTTFDDREERKTTINSTTYRVGDSEHGYSYNTGAIVGIDEVANEMLIGETLADSTNEKFYKIQKPAFTNKSTILNDEIYPEWFKASSHVDDTISLSIALLLSSFSKTKVACASKRYTITNTLHVMSNTQIIGNRFDIDSGSVIECICSKGLLIYDLDATNIRIYGLLITTDGSSEYFKNYIGIDLQCGNANIDISHITIRRANIAINAVAYGVVQLINIHDICVQTSVSGFYGDSIFYDRTYAYVNAVRLQIIEAITVDDWAVKVVKCVGITIASSYSEILGNVPIYCDSSMIQIEGITWNESGAFVKAVNKSFVRILGDPLAYGSVDKDSTSVIIQDPLTYRDLLVLNRNCETSTLLNKAVIFDFINRRYIDSDGRELFKTDYNSIQLYDGKYYFNGTVDLSDTELSSIDLNNKSIFLRCRCNGAGTIDLGFARFRAVVSQYRDSNLVLEDSNNNNCGYCVKGEQIIKIYVQDGKYWLSSSNKVNILNTDEQHINGSFSKIQVSSSNFVVSDIVIINKLATSRLDIISSRNIVENISNVSSFKNQYRNLVWGEKELIYPKLEVYPANYNIYKLDLANNRYVDKNGRVIATATGSPEKKMINGHPYVTRVGYDNNNKFVVNTPINILNKTVLIKFALLNGTVSDSNMFHLGFTGITVISSNGVYLRGTGTDNTAKIAMSLQNVYGEHIIGLRCYEYNGSNVADCLNRTTNKFKLYSGNTGQIKNIYCFCSSTNLNLFISDFMVVDKLIEDDDEFFYYQKILRESSLPARTKSEIGSTRPEYPLVGDCFFDNSLSTARPIWAKTVDKSTSPYTVTWVDATGAIIS